MENLVPLACIYRAKSAGKLILCGEHSVVYGHPAIACAIENALITEIEINPSKHGIEFDFQILKSKIDYLAQDLEDIVSFEKKQAALLSQNQIDSRLIFAIGTAFERFGLIGHAKDFCYRMVVKGELPIGVGLGSSASLSIALIKALAFLCHQSLDDEDLDRSVLALEKQFHANPSGLDQYVIIHGGVWQFQKQLKADGESSYHLEKIKLKRALSAVVSWVPRQGDSKQAVLMVKENRQRYPALYDGVFEQISQLVADSKSALLTGELQALGTLFQLNHGYLNALGLSTASIEKIIEIAKQNGAFAAKLTGAGLGGAVLILCELEDQTKLCDALKKADFPAFATTIEA